MIDPWLTEAGPRAADQSAAAAWRRYGRGAQWSQPSAAPRIAITFDVWGWPRFYATSTTPNRQCWRSPAHFDSPAYYETPGSPTTTAPAVLPWGPDFRAANGEDGGCLIELPTVGWGWEALNIRPADPLTLFLIDWRMAIEGSPNRTQPGDLIADQLNLRTPQTRWTYNSNGGGKLGGKASGELCADDFELLDIGHAMQLTGFTHWGPGGRFIGPVTRQEHPGPAPAGYPKALTSGNNPRVPPAGTRLRWALTDDDIAAFIRKRGHRGVLADTCAKLMRGTRRYGLFHGTDTGVGDPCIVATGNANPVEAAKWKALGINPTTAVTLLDGAPWEKLEVCA